MNHEKLAEVINVAVRTQKPLLILGEPGIGKTDSVWQACARNKIELHVAHPVVDQPEDYKGLPAVVRDADGKASAEFLAFGDQHKLFPTGDKKVDDKPLVYAFDDLGQAAPAVQGAAMQLLLARSLNGRLVRGNVTFIAMSNRRKDKAGVGGLITPLLDRFHAVITLTFNLDDWCLWALQNGMPDVLVAWARNDGGKILGRFEPTKDMDKQPTPRSVAMAGKWLNDGVDDAEVLAGAAGGAFATDFLAFKRMWDELPDINEILMDPAKAPVPDKPDVTFATIGKLAAHAAEKNLDAVNTYIKRLPRKFNVCCMKDIMARNPKLRKHPVYNRWIVENQGIFK